MKWLYLIEYHQYNNVKRVCVCSTAELAEQYIKEVSGGLEKELRRYTYTPIEFYEE